MLEHYNKRNTKPITIKPLTAAQALRHAMTVPAPEHDPPAPKAKKGAKKAPKK
jgi:hypothetical protein